MEDLKSLYEKYKENIESYRLNKNNDSEFGHLSEQIYLDYAANSIYMSSLIKDYYTKLTNNHTNGSWSLFSNPHSHSQSGSYTNLYIDLTRQKILKLFNTDSNEYDVIFVMNSTHALKLLAESFNFEEETNNDDKPISNEKSYFVYLNDNHTSVIGMREIVWQSSPNTDVFCLFENENDSSNIFNAKMIESSFKNEQSINSNTIKRNLFVYPAQSNFNGRKYDLNLINQIKENGLNSNFDYLNKGEWLICLDAASYVSTSHLDLSVSKPDFLVLSFYKIFGFPTGIGSLLVKKSEQTKRCFNKKQYFGGGTVSMALIDQNKVCLKNCSIKHKGAHKIENTCFHDFFEDGTVSYLQIIGVSLAIDKLEFITFNRGLRLIESYVNDLTEYCIEKMNRLKHFNNKNLVEIYRKYINNSITKNYGPIISFNLKNSSGNYIGFTLVDKLAQENQIHLRTGCFCNIGACQLFMKHLNETKKYLENFELYGHKCGDHIDLINEKPTGAIRVSFGYSTIKNDIDFFLKFLCDNFIENKPNNYDRVDKSESYIIPEKQYFKITQIYLYPIKSCAPMKIDSSWPIVKGLGLQYDRIFIIVDNNRVSMTQKRFPFLIKLIPNIDLESKKLNLYFDEHSFQLDLESNRNNNVVYVENLAGYDQGDEVSAWLTNVLGLKNDCRLIRVINSNDHIQTDKDINIKKSYVNKSDYLLISENSVKKLRKFLLNSLDENSKINLNNPADLNLIDTQLLLQFRPNIIVNIMENTLNDNSLTVFDEEFWTGFKILRRNLEFKIVNNCTRCQMININQNSSKTKNQSFNPIDLSIICSSLLKQIYKLKSNSKFGVYLTQLTDKSNEDTNIDKISQEYSDRLYSKISVGDIGVSFLDKKKSVNREE